MTLDKQQQQTAGHSHCGHDDCCGVHKSAIGYRASDFVTVRAIERRPSDIQDASFLESQTIRRACTDEMFAGALCKVPKVSFEPSAESESRRRRALESGLSPLGPVLVGDIAYFPDPGEPGPFHVCQSDPKNTFKIDTNPPTRLQGQDVPFVVYAPGTSISERLCRAEAIECPFVVILHADPIVFDPEMYLNYELMGRHLASHGFVVAVLDRSKVSSFTPEPQALVLSFLNSIEAGLLGVRSVISNKLVLVGHSAGGTSVGRLTALAPADLQDWEVHVVLMTTGSIQTSFNGFARSLFAIHVRTDSDLGTSGGVPGPTDVAKGTTVAYYEKAAVLVDPNGFEFEKHLLYVGEDLGKDEGVDEGFSHFFQDEFFARAYVCAFLHAYVRGHAAYRQFVKYQRPIPSLQKETPIVTVSHLHEDTTRRVIVDFSGVPSPVKVTAVNVEVTGPGPAYMIDDYALNSGLVLKLHLTVGNGVSEVELSWSPAVVSAVGFRYLGIELCQTHAEGEFWRPDLGVRVILRSGFGGLTTGAVDIKELGRQLQYPRFYTVKGSNRTHTSLDLFMIPLLWYSEQGVLLNDLRAVKLDFSGNVAPHTADVLVGTVKLLK